MLKFPKNIIISWMLENMLNKKNDFLFMFVILIVLSYIFIFVPILSENVEVEPHISFHLHFNNPNFEDYSIEATLYSHLDSLTINKNKILFHILNSFDGKIMEQIIETNQKEDWITENVSYFNYKDESSINFILYGISEFYPFDSYYLNLTFVLPDSEKMLNNANIIIDARMLYEEQTGWIVKNYGDLKLTREPVYQDMIFINQQFVFRRTSWSVEAYKIIIQMGFLILGSIVLINPDELRTKTGIYIAVLLSFSTLYFNISLNIPKRYDLTILEKIFLYLIIGMTFSLVLSIMQYKFIHISTSKTNRILIELIGLIPISIIFFYMYMLFNSIKKFSQYYFWIEIPSYMAYFIYIVLFFFWIFNFALLISRMRNKT